MTRTLIGGSGGPCARAEHLQVGHGCRCTRSGHAQISGAVKLRGHTLERCQRAPGSQKNAVRTLGPSQPTRRPPTPGSDTGSLGGTSTAGGRRSRHGLPRPSRAGPVADRRRGLEAHPRQRRGASRPTGSGGHRQADARRDAPHASGWTATAGPTSANLPPARHPRRAHLAPRHTRQQQTKRAMQPPLVKRLGTGWSTGGEVTRVEVCVHAELRTFKNLAASRRCTNPFAESVVRLLGWSHELRWHVG